MVWEAEFMEGVAKYILATGGTGGVKYLLPLAWKRPYNDPTFKEKMQSHFLRNVSLFYT